MLTWKSETGARPHKYNENSKNRQSSENNNQLCDRHKNNNSLRRTREGGPTNITKVTNLAKIRNQQARESKISNMFKTERGRGSHKYTENNKSQWRK